MNKDKIKDFIENFKNRNGEENRLGIEEFFMNGGCYWFAKILQDRFPYGKIMYHVRDNHFIFYGGNTLDIWNNGIFDIRGEVTQTYINWVVQGTVVEWDRYDDTVHKSRIWRDCIAFEEENNGLGYAM